MRKSACESSQSAAGYRGEERDLTSVVQLNGGDSAHFLPFGLTASIRETDSFLHFPLFSYYCTTESETLNQPTARLV